MALNPEDVSIGKNDNFVHIFEENSQLNKEQEEYIRAFQTVDSLAKYVFLLHMIIVLLGFIANIFVISRIIKFAKANPEKYRNGIGILLLIMAISDILSLLTITSQYGLGMTLIEKSEIKLCLCKLFLFLTHTATSVSIWSWVLMSFIRYLAIRHPMLHLRIWSIPKRAIGFIILMSSLFNAWLLFAVENKGNSCEQVALFGNYMANRVAQLIEIFWSFCIPAALILYMDLAVMLVRSQSQSFLSNTPHPINCSSSTKTSLQTTRTLAVRIWLTMAFIDVIFNAPDNIYRIIILIGVNVTIPTHYHYGIRMIFQLLYFAQFAFNALYMAVFVYDKSTRPTSSCSRKMVISKTNNGRHFVSYGSAMPLSEMSEQL